MKSSTILFFLSCAIITVVAVVIKFYFMPLSDKFLEMTVENQMKREMQAFEKIIVTVTRAADGNKSVVRRALFAISQDKSIPIELRRSKLIDEQYGKKPGKSPQNKFELEVMNTGVPIFRKTKKNFEYIYPLKALPVCGNCHANAQGQKPEPGHVMGLAVKQVPTSVLRKSSLTYFIKDLFWENLLMVSLSIGCILIFVMFWMVNPLQKIAKDIENYYGEEEIEESLAINEVSSIQKGVKLLLNKLREKDRS